MRVRSIATCVALGFVLAVAPAFAAPVTHTLNLRVNAVDPGVTAVAVGDRFTIVITLEDSTVDTNAAVGAGSFPGLLTNFVVTANPANTGTWTPSGAFDLGAVSNYVTNALGNGVTLQVRGTGFPSGGTGLVFRDFDLAFGYPDIVDSGLGDTFAAQLNGTPFGSHTSFGGRLRFTDGQDFPAATLVIDSAPPVGPAIPATGAIGLAALMLLIACAGWLLTRSS